MGEHWKEELASGGMEDFWDQTLYEWRDGDGNTHKTSDGESFMVTGNFKMENVVEVDFVYGDPTIRKDLEAMPLEQYDAGLVLTLDSELSLADNPLSADSRAFVSMLLLRSIMTTRKHKNSCLVAEIQDPRTADVMS